MDEAASYMHGTPEIRRFRRVGCLCLFWLGHGALHCRWSDFHDPAWVCLVVAQRYEERHMRIRYSMATRKLGGQWKQHLCIGAACNLHSRRRLFVLCRHALCAQLCHGPPNAVTQQLDGPSSLRCPAATSAAACHHTSSPSWRLPCQQQSY